MSKKPIVLIHGLGLCQDIWRPYVPALEDAGHEVITYDLYGHGMADPAPEDPSLGLFARQILGLMNVHQFDQAHLVGFSIGGMINRRFALDYPDRVASLAIWNSPHDRGTQAQALVEARAKKVWDEGPFATLDAALDRWFTPAFRANHPEILNEVRRWRRQVHASSYAGAAWVLANGVVELTGASMPAHFPAQVLTCENDTGSTPSMAQAIAKDMNVAAPHIVPNLQHLGLMERPDLFLSPLLKFLETCS